MWEKIKAGIQKFMYGRYGIDELNKVILVASLVMCILSLFIKQMWISLLCWGLMLWWVFRAFSKNTTARWNENEKFMGFIKYVKAVFTQGREYKVFRCRKCGRIIRVPRRHGRVEVTCPQCGEKRIVETGKKE